MRKKRRSAFKKPRTAKDRLTDINGNCVMCYRNRNKDKPWITKGETRLLRKIRGLPQ